MENKLEVKGGKILKILVTGSRMTSLQLSNLSFEEDEDGGHEVEEVGRKKAPEGRVNRTTSGRTPAGITEVLGRQEHEAALMEALKQSQEQNSKLWEWVKTKQAREHEDEELYTREEGILYAFEGKVEDDAESVVCHEVRTGLRPFRGDWTARWRSLGRHAKPPHQSLGLPQLGTIMLSPIVVKKMHDRGLDLKLAMFIHKNQDVSVRAAKWRKVGEGRDAIQESHDWKDPENAQAVADGVLNYMIALWRIWPEDWSGLVLCKVLLRFKYLANVKASKKGQLNMLTHFVDAFLGLCAAAGREHRPPPIYSDAESLMLEHLHANNQDAAAVRGGQDLYQVKASQVNQGNVGNQGNGGNLGNGSGNKVPRNNGGPKQGGAPRDIFNMPLGLLNIREKVELACKGYNGQGCQVAQCKFRHQCNKVDGNKVCFGDHRVQDHK